MIELTGADGAWSWQGDLRRDDSSDFGAITTGRLGAAFALAPGLRLRALAGTTFRAPSFNDLYFPGYGVASLRPERGRSTELGLSWKQAAGELAVTAWRNPVRDLIGYEPDAARCPADPAYAFGCAANTAQAQLSGVTLAASRQMGPLAVKAQVDLLRARDGATGQRLLRRAAQQASVGMDWTRGEWTYGGRLLHVGSRADGGKTLASESTLDLLATWRIAPAWSLQGKLVNATDAELEPARDYQGLGRQAWISLRFEFR